MIQIIMDKASDTKEFKDKVEEFVKNRLTPVNEFQFNYSQSGKYIHDTVWGTTFYYPWEIALLDCPIIQRLRSIHQTGLAFFVYPTTTHTRFDHTLGVVAIVDRLIENLNKKPSSDSDSFGTNVISDEERITLRLAALLHDIGHGPFSHVSEQVFGQMPEFIIIKNWIAERYKVTPSPHEILGFLIVSSTNFNSWFDEYIRKLIPPSYSKVINLSKVAEYIIGYSVDRQKKYLADIINGPMDADKLDYLARDAKLSGLKIGYDVDRYFKTINIHRRTCDDLAIVRLGVPLSGVNSLEQMIISLTLSH